MASAKINKRNNTLLLIFFIIAYAIFGLLYTETGQDVVDSVFTLVDMPDAGISAPRVKDAERNEVLDSALNVDPEFLSTELSEDEKKDLDYDEYTDEDRAENEKFARERELAQVKAEKKRLDQISRNGGAFERDPLKLKENYMKTHEYKKKKPEYDHTEKRFEKRVKTLKSFCDTYGKLPDLSMENFVPEHVERMHKNMIYTMGKKGAVCSPYKTGNNLFSQFSCYLSDPKECDIYMLKRKFKGMPRLWANKLKEGKTSREILGPKKDNLILTTRHPLERAVATWHTTFRRELPLSRIKSVRAKRLREGKEFHPKISPFMMMYNRTIRRTLKISKIQDLGDDSHWITFAQYVGWITAEHQGNHNMILPQFEFCDICSRKYKYVIKTRTMEEDVEYLMKMSDLNEDYYHSNPIHQLDGKHIIASHDPWTSPKKAEKDLNGYVRKYLRTLEGSDFEKLVNKYKIDMEAFGYTVDHKSKDIGGLTS